MEKMIGTSMDIELGNVEKIKELFPNAVTEGKIDFDMLRTMLGDEVEEAKEKYQFTWKGKAESIKIAQKSSTSTLRPCKEKSEAWESTKNLYIEGDNLEVLKQLQKTYYGRIGVIYIDPPYNTGGDFVYKDNFKDSIQNYIEQTNQSNKSNPETFGRFHSAWLNMMYPRLILARNLLSDNGVCFISIDDHELYNIKKILDEVFGENNFIGSLPRVTKKSGKDHSDGIAKNNDYVMAYCKNINFLSLKGIETSDDDYPLKDEFYAERGGYKLNQTLDYDSLWYNPTMDFEIKCGNEVFFPGGDKKKHEDRHSGNHKSKDWVWRWSKEKFDFGWKNGFVVIKEGRDRKRIYTKTYSKARISNSRPYTIEYSNRSTPLSSLELVNNEYSNDNAKKEITKLKLEEFEFPKPTSLIKKLISLCDDDAIVLDFFSGSASTAHAVLQQNAEDDGTRSFILVQLPETLEGSPNNFETICNLGEERIRRAGNKIAEEWEKTQNEKGFLADNNDFSADIGFKVFKLDSTNINPWDNTAEYDESSLFNTASVFKLDRSNEDVLYEIMLKYGVFDQPASEVEINGKTMYRVGQRHMIVCLEDNIDDNDITEICKLEPRIVVFKEDGFKDDNAKINAEYNLIKSGVEDVKCI